MRVSAREGKLLLAGVVVAVLVVAYLKVVDPAWREWNELTLDLANQKRELARLKAAQHRPDYSSLEAKIRPQFGALLTNDSEAAHAAAKIQAMERICKVSGLRILSYHPLATSTVGDHWRRHPLKVLLEGDIAELTDTLFRINNELMLMDVERMDLRRQSDKTDQLNCDLLLSTFSYSEKPLRKRRKG